jgi:hypothetical protein
LKKRLATDSPCAYDFAQSARNETAVSEPSATDEYLIDSDGTDKDAPIAPSPTPLAPIQQVPEKPRDDKGRFVPPAAPIPQVISEPTPAHPAYLVRRAARYGMNEADLTHYTAAQLEAVLDDRESNAVQFRKENQEFQMRQEAVNRGKQPSAPSAAPQVEPEPAEGFYEFLDPGLAAHLKKQAGRIKQLEEKLGTIDQTVGQVTQHLVRKENESNREMMDRVFSERENVFGTGKGIEKKPDDPDFLRRMAVLKTCDSMPGTVSEEKIRKAIATLYPSSQKPPKPPPPASEPPVDHQRVEEWQNGTVFQPTQRQEAPEAPGRTKAEKSVADWQKQRGIYVNSVPESPDDATPADFPD